MPVHVADGVNWDSRIGDCHFDGLLHGLLLGRCQVVAVGVCAESDELRVDLGASGFRVFVFLENERAAAFADDEAVAVLVVACRGEFRGVVLVGGGEEGVEYCRLCRVEFFGPAGDHGVLHAVLDVFVCGADADAAGGACRVGGVQPSGEAEIDGDVHGAGLRHGLDVGCRRDFGAVVGGYHREEVDERKNASRAGTVCDAHAAGLQKFCVLVEAGIFEGLDCGQGSEHGHSAHAADFAARKFRERVVDGGGETCIHLLVTVPVVHANNLVLQLVEILEDFLDFAT